jgi:hypothetical protein
MSQNIALLTLTAVATAPLVTNRFVAAGGVPAVAGGNTLGVAHFGANPGQACPVTVLGTEITEAGGAIPAGSGVEVDALQRAVLHAQGVKVGLALESANQAGDMIEVLLIQN